MYTIFPTAGEVYRNSDNKLVAPCQSADDPDYQAYVAWVNDGNEPTLGTVAPSEIIAIREKMWDAIKAERDRRKFAGVHVAAINKWFNSDDSSRIQQLGLVMMGANLPAGIMWKTMDNTFVQMTPQIAGAIFQTTAASDMAIFTAAEVHKAQMSASADPENYDMFSGTPPWPKVYGE